MVDSLEGKELHVFWGQKELYPDKWKFSFFFFGVNEVL